MCIQLLTPVVPQVAFGSNLSHRTWSDHSLGLKHTQGKGKLIHLVDHTLRGSQISSRNPFFQVGWAIFHSFVAVIIGYWGDDGFIAQPYFITCLICFQQHSLSISFVTTTDSNSPDLSFKWALQKHRKVPYLYDQLFAVLESLWSWGLPWDNQSRQETWQEMHSGEDWCH